MTTETHTAPARHVSAPAMPVACTADDLQVGDWFYEPNMDRCMGGRIPWRVVAIDRDSPLVLDATASDVMRRWAREATMVLTVANDYNPDGRVTTRKIPADRVQRSVRSSDRLPAYAADGRRVMVSVPTD